MWRLPVTLWVVVILLADGAYRVRPAAFDDSNDDDDAQVGRSFSALTFVHHRFPSSAAGSC